MFFLTPRYLKNARLLHKGVTRFLDYKRDILPADKLDRIMALREELGGAMKARNRERLDGLNKEINEVCQQSLPNLRRSEIGENIEVFFVAIVIALGIRAYIAQPFKIPTGSMQPTLNGIILTRADDDPRPGMVTRFAHWFRGRTYLNVVADRDGTLDPRNPISESSSRFDLKRFGFGFLSNYTVLNFTDGDKLHIPGPRDKVMIDLGLAENLAIPTYDTGYRTPDEKPVMGYRIPGQPIRIEKGQILARGIHDGGDHVLVNKFSYHFRRPKRGEVFVFTTDHIRGINVPREQGAQHYIKRLVGMPGDRLEVREPELWVNGQPAAEPGMARVASLRKPYLRGYVAINQLAAGREVSLRGEQYWAMGDNSANSSDSRYWGPVPERNLVGPALMSYFPFSTHWGLIP